MGRALSVLYVEDDPDIQEIGRIALADIGGFAVRVCSDATEALEAAAHCTPDLLLLDVMMPGTDGPTLLKKLRDLPSTAQTPAVFMTARVQPAEVAHYLTLGAVKVISKPFDPMSLAADLEAVVTG